MTSRVRAIPLLLLWGLFVDPKRGAHQIFQNHRVCVQSPPQCPQLPSFLFLTPQLPLPESRALLALLFLLPTPCSGMDSRLKPQAPHFPSLPFHPERLSPKPPCGTEHCCVLSSRAGGSQDCVGPAGPRERGPHGVGRWSEPAWGRSMSVWQLR